MLSKISGILLSVLIPVSGALAVGPQVTADRQVTFKVLHNFTGGSDGGCIYGGLARSCWQPVWRVRLWRRVR
jgi:hypothetical protein